MHELKIHDGNVRVCEVGGRWAVVGNEVGTQAQPDARSLVWLL